MPFVNELYLFDFTVTNNHDSCMRCGYTPAPGTRGLLNINLWSAPGITTLAGQRRRESRWDDDPIVLDVAEQDMTWATICGDCDHQLEAAGAKHRCVATVVETTG